MTHESQITDIINTVKSNPLLDRQYYNTIFIKHENLFHSKSFIALLYNRIQNEYKTINIEFLGMDQTRILEKKFNLYHFLYDFILPKYELNLPLEAETMYLNNLWLKASDLLYFYSEYIRTSTDPDLIRTYYQKFRNVYAFVEKNETLFETFLTDLVTRKNADYSASTLNTAYESLLINLAYFIQNEKLHGEVLLKLGEIEGAHLHFTKAMKNLKLYTDHADEIQKLHPIKTENDLKHYHYLSTIWIEVSERLQLLETLSSNQAHFLLGAICTYHKLADLHEYILTGMNTESTLTEQESKCRHEEELEIFKTIIVNFELCMSKISPEDDILLNFGRKIENINIFLSEVNIFQLKLDTFYLKISNTQALHTLEIFTTYFNKITELYFAIIPSLVTNELITINNKLIEKIAQIKNSITNGESHDSKLILYHSDSDSLTQVHISLNLIFAHVEGWNFNLQVPNNKDIPSFDSHSNVLTPVTELKEYIENNQKKAQLCLPSELAPLLEKIREIFLANQNALFHQKNLPFLSKTYLTELASILINLKRNTQLCEQESAPMLKISLIDLYQSLLNKVIANIKRISRFILNNEPSEVTKIKFNLPIAVPSLSILKTPTIAAPAVNRQIVAPPPSLPKTPNKANTSKKKKQKSVPHMPAQQSLVPSPPLSPVVVPLAKPAASVSSSTAHTTSVEDNRPEKLSETAQIKKFAAAVFEKSQTKKLKKQNKVRLQAAFNDELPFSNAHDELSEVEPSHRLSTDDEIPEITKNLSTLSLEQTQNNCYHVLVPFEIQDILNKLTQDGFEALIYGGAVRDLLLNIPPNDFDIVSNNPNILRILGEECEPSLWVQNHFKYRDIDISFKPTLDLNQLALSRDLKLNALFVNHKAQVIDPLDFISSGLLREKYLSSIVPTAESFRQDPSRIFRMIRISLHTSLRIHPEDLNVIKDHMPLITRQVPIRVYLKQIELIFKAKEAVAILTFIRNNNLFFALFPTQMVRPTPEKFDAIFSFICEKVNRDLSQFSRYQLFALLLLPLYQENSDALEQFLDHYQGQGIHDEAGVLRKNVSGHLSTLSLEYNIFNEYKNKNYLPSRQMHGQNTHDTNRRPYHDFKKMRQ